MADMHVLVYLSILCVNARETGEPTSVAEAFDTTTSDFINCLLNTTYYDGTRRTTDNGHTCKRWDSDVPTKFDDSDFRQDGSVEQASNYCRDPDNSGYLWCFVIEEVVWEKCSTKCDEERTEKPKQEPTTKPSKEKVEFFQSNADIWRCTTASSCEPDEKLLCIDTMSTVDMEGCTRTMCCYKRGCSDVPANKYTGRWSNARTGKVCLYWDSITEYQLDPDVFPDETLSDAKNYCRNVFNEVTPSCFVNENTTDYCGIPSCTELASRHRHAHDCYEVSDKDRHDEICENSPYRKVTDGNTYPGCKNCTCCQRKECYKGASTLYTGTWTRTMSGRECIPWMESTYAQDFVYMWIFGNQFRESGNSCRDFFGYGRTFCQTRDPNMINEYCSLTDACPGEWNKESTAAVGQTTTSTVTFTDTHTSAEVPKMSTKPAVDNITHYDGYSTSDVPKRSTKLDIEETTFSDEHSTTKVPLESTKPAIDDTTLSDEHSTSTETLDDTNLPIEGTTLSHKHRTSEKRPESTEPVIETTLSNEQSTIEESKESTKSAQDETTFSDEHSTKTEPLESAKPAIDDTTLSDEHSTSTETLDNTNLPIERTTLSHKHRTSEKLPESTEPVIEITTLSDEYSTIEESKESTKSAQDETTFSNEHSTSEKLVEITKPANEETTLSDKHSTSNESPHGTKLPIEETTLSDKHSKSEEPLESTKPVMEKTTLTDEHSSTEELKENTKPAIKETTLSGEHSISEEPPENTKQDKEEITLSYESSTSDVRKTKTKPAINDTTPVEEHWTSHEYLESTKLVKEETSLSDKYSTSNESRETTKPATEETTLSGEIETEQTLSKSHANQFVTNVLFIAVVWLLLI